MRQAMAVPHRILLVIWLVALSTSRAQIEIENSDHICGKTEQKVQYEVVEFSCEELNNNTDVLIERFQVNSLTWCKVNRTTIIPPLNICCFGWKGIRCTERNDTTSTQGYASYNYATSMMPGITATFHQGFSRECSLLTGLLLRNDGVRFRFPERGSYKFAYDKETDDKLFTIQIRSNPTCLELNRPNCHMVSMRFEDTNIDLTLDGRVLVNGRECRYPYRAQEEKFTIFKESYVLIVKTYIDLQVTLINGHTIDVYIPPMWTENVDGLCGDIPYINYEPMSGVDFINKNALTDDFQQMESIGDPCQETGYEGWAHRECAFLFRPPFSDADSVDLEAAHFSCLAFVCNCLANNKENCQPCAVAEYLSYKSNNKGIRIENWRTEEFCPVRCPETMILEECSLGIKTCDAVKFPSSSGKCVPRCVCPDDLLFDGVHCVKPRKCPCESGMENYPVGAVISQTCNHCICFGQKWECSSRKCPGECTVLGSGLFKTFDGKWIHATRQSKYLMTKNQENTGHKFNVMVDNCGCTLGQHDAHIKEVEVVIENVAYRFSGSSEFTVKGVSRATPFSDDNAEIQSMLGHFFQLRTPFGLQVSVSFNTSRVYVELSEDLGNKVTGVCGDYNDNEQDDFNCGGIFRTQAKFLDHWMVNDLSGLTTNPEFSDPLGYLSQYRQYASQLCNKVMATLSSKYSHFVDPKEYIEECVKAVIRGKGGQRTGISSACSLFFAYGLECTKRGAEIEWQIPTECESKCPFPMEWRIKCEQSQAITCLDMNSPSINQGRCFDGCFCPNNQVLDESKERCVEPSHCSCLHENKYYDNGEARETRCGSCKCKGGKWNCEDDQCEPGETDKCQNGRVWTNCTGCERKCFELSIQCVQRAEDCEEGCTCPDGLVWDGEKCVTEEQCGCQMYNKKYNVGDIYTFPCEICTCAGNEWKCVEKPCPKTCRAWGDPHYETFDGKRYEFQGDCSYVLVEDDCGTGEGNFSIIAENVPCGAGGTSCTKAIKFSLQGFEIKMVGGADISVQNKASVGKRFTDVFLKKTVGIYVVIQTKAGITLKWDRGTSIYISLDSRYKGKVCGLCGNFNGIPRDDFTTEQGETEASPRFFGHSWRTEDCEIPPPPTDPCEINPARRTWAEYSCAIIKQGIFSSCHSEVDPDPYYSNCVMDTCACDRGGDCECLCTAIAAYTEQCSENGVPIRWRSDGTCGLQCDEGKVYKECGSACDNACYIEGSEDFGCEETCVEGCFCPSGQVEFEGRCIVRDLCPCIVDGQEIPAGTDFISDDYCCHCYSGEQYTCGDLPCVETTTVISTTSIKTSPGGYGSYSSPHQFQFFKPTYFLVTPTTVLSLF